MRRTALTLAVVAGCGSTGDPPADPRLFDPCQLAVTGQATATQRASIADATAMWRTHAEATADAVTVQFKSAPSVDLGFYDITTGTIFVNLDLGPSPRTITIAHELGHAFGLLHVTDRPSVMNPGNLTVVPNDGDLAAVAARWGSCPP